MSQIQFVQVSPEDSRRIVAECKGVMLQTRDGHQQVTRPFCPRCGGVVAVTEVPRDATASPCSVTVLKGCGDQAFRTLVRRMAVYDRDDPDRLLLACWNCGFTLDVAKSDCPRDIVRDGPPSDLLREWWSAQRTAREEADWKAALAKYDGMDPHEIRKAAERWEKESHRCAAGSPEEAAARREALIARSAYNRWMRAFDLGT